MEIEIPWDYILAIVVIVTAGGALFMAGEKMTAADFIAILGMVFSFLGGSFVGYKAAIREVRKLAKPD